MAGIEGNPYSSYSWIALVLSMPINLLFEIYGIICAWTTKHTVVGSDKHIPKNSIVYLYHQEMAAAVVTADYWTTAVMHSNCRASYLGYHGFLSYMASLPFVRRGWLACRYNRHLPSKPFDQIVKFLKVNQGPFVIRTDAGGPYGVVRTSLVRLSLATERPIVPVRQTTNRSVTILKHIFPIPGSNITTHIGEPITPETIRSMGEEAALIQAQKAIDQLTSTYSLR